MSSLAEEPPGVRAPGRSTVGRILGLAWPVLAQQFLLLLVGLSDQYLAGHYEPPDPSQHAAYQAAQTTANYLGWSISSLTTMVTVGATALVARFVGAGKLRMAIYTTNQSLLLAMLVGIGISTIGLLTIRPLIDLLRLNGDAAGFAVSYLEPLLLLLVFQIIELGGIACLVGAGDTRMGLWVMTGVAVVNLPLAWSLCHGWGPFPEMGFVGISTGTAISHVLGCGVILMVLSWGRAGLWLVPRLLLPDRGLLVRLLRISIPASIDSLSLAAGQLWFLSLVNHLGDVASSAHGIAIRWEALGYLSGSAIGTAAMTLVGQNLGARRPHEAARSGWYALALGAGIMTTMGMVFFALAPAMFRLFCPYTEQVPIIEAGVPVLRLVAFAMPALACVIIFMSALRGAGDTRWPVLFTWVGFLLVRIPLAYVLTRDTVDLGSLGTLPGWNLGLFGAWLAMFVDLHLRGLLFLLRFASGRWKMIRV